MAEEEVGVVSNYFARISVAGIELKGTLRVGDRIRFHGASTDFEQVVESMQLNNVPVQEATAGQAVGVRVVDRVRQGDRVYRIS